MGSIRVSDATHAKLMRDLQLTGRAVIVKGLFGRWRRVLPSRTILLEPVYSPEAVHAAKEDGSLVQEFPRGEVATNVEASA